MITVDKKKFRTRQSALKFFMEAMFACDGSEQQRMIYVFNALSRGVQQS